MFTRFPLVPRLAMFGLLLAMIPTSLYAQPQGSRGPITYEDTTLDEQGVILENSLIHAEISPAAAGQVLKFVYKPTGDQLASPATRQGMSIERMGEERFFWRNKSEQFKGRIVEQTADHVTAEVTYVWRYNYNNIQTDILVTKTYTLHKDSAILWLGWKLTNQGEFEAGMTPWIKHVGQQTETLLNGPTLLAQKEGVISKLDFTNPVRNWTLRTTGQSTDESKVMLASLTNFTQTYQQFPWQGAKRFSLETVMNHVRLKPGESWETRHAVSVMPNLGNVRSVTPEVSVGLAAGSEEQLVVGVPAKLTLELAPAAPLGAMRLEGSVLRLSDDAQSSESVAELPRQEMMLTPGKITRVTYEFTPTQAGVYHLNLSLYRGQNLYSLGQDVGSQERNLVIPIVAGKAADDVVMLGPWDTGGVAWKTFTERVVQPRQLLARHEKLSVAGFTSLDRVMKQDTIDTTGKLDDTIQISAARGEWESTQFVVSASESAALRNVTVNVGELRNKAGDVLPHAKLYQVKTVTTTTPSGYQAQFPVGQWPDPLWAVPEAINIEAGTHQSFWLTLEAPRDAPAGMYEAPVTIHVDGKTAASFKLSMRVRSFALPKHPSLAVNTGRVGWYNMKKNLVNLQKVGYVPTPSSARELDDQFWAMTTAYGMSPRRTDVAKWEQFKDHGRGITAYHVGGVNAKAEQWLADNDLLKQSYIYAPFDEHTDARVPEVVAWIKDFKTKSKVPVMDVYYGSNTGPLLGLVDIWCGQRTDQPWVKERQAAGDRFWSTNNSLIWFVEYPPIQGRNNFWEDFTTGTNGRLLYSTIRWSDDVNKENWSGGGNYLGCTIYPSPQGLSPSIRFEALRDGIEDYDYLVMLRNRVQTYEQNNKDRSLSAYTSAKTFLASGKAIASHSDPVQLLNVRNDIATWIEALDKASAQ